MAVFRFAILGAGHIAAHFCRAVQLVDGCCVCAVASRSLERASGFAAKNSVASAYGSYKEMLLCEKPDCAYIATTGNAHFALSMLCLQCGVPVLCEKAMFLTVQDAKACMQLAAEKQLFVMEAVWSLFLPALRKVKAWLAGDRIGEVVFADMGIGFAAPENADSRYFDPALGGGAAYDITVYGCHIVPWLLGREVTQFHAETIPGSTGVDVTDVVTLRMEGDILATVKATFLAPMEERLVIYGRRGKIVVPNPHFASEAFLYTSEAEAAETYRDAETQNGFTYEIEEVQRCVRQGRMESDTVPHKATLACTGMLESIQNSVKRR